MTATFFFTVFAGFFAVTLVALGLALVVVALALALVVVVALGLALVAGSWSCGVVKKVRKDNAEWESAGAAVGRARSPPVMRRADLALKRDNIEG